MRSGLVDAGPQFHSGAPASSVAVGIGMGLLTCLADAEKARVWMREAINMIAVGADDDSNRCRERVREQERTTKASSRVGYMEEEVEIGNGGQNEAEKSQCGAVDQENSIRGCPPG